MTTKLNLKSGMAIIGVVFLLAADIAYATTQIRREVRVPL